MCQASNKVFSLSAKYWCWVLRRRITEHMGKFVTRNFILWPKKCFSLRAIFFDYVVYVPNVIKVTIVSCGITQGGVFRCLGWFLLTLECRFLNAVRVFKKTGVSEEERETNSRRERESKYWQHSVGPSGPRLIGSNQVEATTRKSHPPVRSFRVLNFNYFELRSGTLGSKRRSICRW